MNEPDELRDRLARLDPGDGEPITPIDSPHGRALLEDIMTTPIDTHDRHDVLGDGPGAAATDVDLRDRRGRRRGGWWLGAAAAAVLAVGVGAIALTGSNGDDEPDLADDTTVDDVVGEAPLALSLGEGQDAMASCIQPSPEIAAMVELGFLGTVASIDGEQVVLDVTRWYTGGDATQVTLTAPAGMEALTGGVDFRVGEEYVVSATDGVVNYCGLSGPAADLRPMFDAAFPG